MSTIITPNFAGIQHTNLQQPSSTPATAGHTAAAPLPPSAQPVTVQQLPANVATVLQQTSRPAIASNTLVTNTASLKTVQPGTLASNSAIMDKLLDHAKATGAPLNRSQIQAFVAMGEHIVKALQNPGQGTAHLSGHVVTSVTPPVQISPNMEAVRAVSWYLAAYDAGQDVAQEASGLQRTLNGAQVNDLTTTGAYVFQDPNNAIFNFLASSPLTYQRPSTHFNAQSATPVQADQTLLQFGIEDSEHQLPGEGGAMLFDKLTGAPGQERMFLKLEHTGNPPLSGHSNRIDNNNEGQGGLLNTFGRMIQDACSYVSSIISAVRSKISALLPLSVNPALLSFNAAVTQLTDSLLKKPIGQASHEYAGYTIPAGIDKQAVKDWHRDGITINGQHHPGHGASPNPQNLNVSTSSAAFIQACNGNTIASEWISRFLNQQLSRPILDFLAEQDFGSSYGRGLYFNGLQPTISIQTLADGSLEATVNFTFAASNTPIIMNQKTVEQVTLPSSARLQGSFTLRFDNLASCNATTPPTPTLSQPLRYSCTGF